MSIYKTLYDHKDTSDDDDVWKLWCFIGLIALQVYFVVHIL